MTVVTDKIPFSHRLAYQVVARPGRKLLHLAVKVSAKVAKKTQVLNNRYLQVVARKGWLISDHSKERKSNERYYAQLAMVLQRLPKQPKISVIMPVYNVSPRFFLEAMGSVAIQSYDNWELCMVDDASTDPRLWQMMEVFAKSHPGKVKIARNDKNVHISATSNRCLELATGDYVTFLDHDDRLYPHALAEMVRHLHYLDYPQVMYSDSRPVTEVGEIWDTNFIFKPAWSPMMHLAFNYTTHATLYERSLVQKVGGFRVGYEGSQDYDLMLRMTEATTKPIGHVPICLYQWRVHAQSTSTTIEAKPYAMNAAIKALTEACQRRGRPAIVEFDKSVEHYHVKFELPKPAPLVSIVIATRDRHDLVKTCLESVFGKSTYAAFEVILVDNGSTDPRIQDLCAEFGRAHPDRFRTIRSDTPFNFGYLNNLGAKEARGDYVLLLNNDTEVRSPDWIQEMLRYAQFPEIGAVGAKLVFPNEKIQHAGLLLVNQSIAVSAFEKYPMNSSYYYNLINTPRECSAVTAACLLVEKRKYWDVGGLDEVAFPNGYGDVDFCLKLTAKGYRCLYTPYAVLTHFESATRGPAVEAFERHEMVRRWGQWLVNDPNLNMNLGRNQHFELLGHTLPELTADDFRYFLGKSAWYRQAIADLSS
jgi:GT2 family glycosyltransferase